MELLFLTNTHVAAFSDVNEKEQFMNSFNLRCGQKVPYLLYTGLRKLRHKRIDKLSSQGETQRNHSTLEVEKKIDTLIGSLHFSFLGNKIARNRLLRLRLLVSNNGLQNNGPSGRTNFNLTYFLFESKPKLIWEKSSIDAELFDEMIGSVLRLGLNQTDCS